MSNSNFPVSRNVLRIAMAQMTSGIDRQTNITIMESNVRKAAEESCGLIAFPELAGLTDRSLAADSEWVTAPEEDPYILAVQESARRNNIWIHSGSTPVLSRDRQRLLNRSCLVNSSGEIVASYDKIHVCDIFPKGADPILESASYEPGQQSVVAPTPWGGFGLSICYDLRFPHLYREYAKVGATVLFVPAAFSVPTGRAHWETLLRARAIENGAFVVAPAQSGKHEDGRETWGHSTIVTPHGEVVVNMGDVNGLSMVNLDLSEVDVARAAVPSLKNERPYQSVLDRTAG